MWIRRDGVRFSGLISVGAVCPHLPILYDPIMKSLHNLNTARAQCRTQCSDDLEGADLMRGTNLAPPKECGDLTQKLLSLKCFKVRSC